MKIVIIYTFSFLVLLISGCSNYKTPSVYRIDIQQGNDITQEMISQLKQDMSKSQVAYVMGTPLIIDTFNPDRWDYLYSFRPGNGLREQRNITIYFKQDKLDRLTGDTRIATSDELTPALRIDSNVIVPLSDKKIGFFNDLKQTIGIEERSIESTSQKKHDLFTNLYPYQKNRQD
jgi:outer membrane protein assembly factor BamE